nr:phosphate ABC transporter substrate-binding protein PstS [Alicyclobacillus mali (ex Roth et al. 2021)]
MRGTISSTEHEQGGLYVKVRSKWFAGLAAVAAVGVVAGCGTSNSSSSTQNAATSNTSQQAASVAKVTLTETGSSLLYPLFNAQWIPAYHKLHPDVEMTAASTGSGTGISDAIAGTVDIGASDAYMADAQIQQHPDMLNIPVAISAQQIMYNLPGVKGHLHLNGQVLAEIYEGKIQYWDDAKIKAINPGVKLPHQIIKPVVRSDGSGDTFLFTQYLSKSSAEWNQNYGFGTTISWPGLQTEIGAKGNQGVVAALSKTAYSVGYVGISWLDKAVQQGLGYAALENKSGSYVLPTSASIQAAAQQGVKNVPADERISLIDEPGANSYPIINFEYVIVKDDQPNAAKADALKTFLEWAINPSQGNSAKFLTPVHFLPLPTSVHAKSEAQIQKIKG